MLLMSPDLRILIELNANRMRQQGSWETLLLSLGEVLNSCSMCEFLFRKLKTHQEIPSETTSVEIALPRA